jgi:ribulose-phosphate 3-epimerase
MPANERVEIAGSILGGDLLNLAEAIRVCERARADLIQIDVCDGVFVPSISFGADIVKRTVESTKLPVEVHLMVCRPRDWIERMADCGHFRMIFHLEADVYSMGVAQAIEDAGWKVGIAINPETPAVAVEPFLPYVDLVLVMGLAPGFAGRRLLDYTYIKIEDVRALIEKTGSSAKIEVDGGVKASNAKQLVDAGADLLVVSSGIYNNPKPDESLDEIRRIIAG